MRRAAPSAPSAPLSRVFGLCLIAFACACSEQSAGLDALWPAHFPPPQPTPHAITEEGVSLGEALFFDVRLSANNTLACASCHEPERAFSDGVARSQIGLSGALLDRNAPGLTNVAWVDALFWDGGMRNLESLVLSPLTNPDEMGEHPLFLMEELGEDAALVARFEAAFRGEGMSISTLMRALAQYMRTLVSASSRYDDWVTHRRPTALGDTALRGFAVYERVCARCHTAPLFTDNRYYNKGLETEFVFDDPEDPGLGRARISFDDADLGKYRTPTLRNLGYTAPYMHDGRLATLAEVIEHYRNGMQYSPTIDPGFIREDGSVGVDMSDEEAHDLLDFLRALDDDAFVRRHAR